MDASNLSLIAGALLSLFFGYVPGVKQQYDALSTEAKRLVMAVLLLIAAAGLYAAGCGDVFGVAVECGRDGIVEIVGGFIAALVANQGTFLIAVKGLGSDGDSAETTPP